MRTHDSLLNFAEANEAFEYLVKILMSCIDLRCCVNWLIVFFFFLVFRWAWSDEVQNCLGRGCRVPEKRCIQNRWILVNGFHCKHAQQIWSIRIELLEHSMTTSLNNFICSFLLTILRWSSIYLSLLDHSKHLKWINNSYCAAPPPPLLLDCYLCTVPAITIILEDGYGF